MRYPETDEIEKNVNLVNLVAAGEIAFSKSHLPSHQTMQDWRTSHSSKVVL